MPAIDLLRLFIITWNVGGQAPTSDLDLTGLYLKCKDEPDFWIVGLQEATGNLPNLGSSSKKWESAFSDMLSEYDYVKIQTLHLQGIMLLVFALSKHKEYISNIEVLKTPTGIGNIWGNKGVISMRMDFKGVSLCFVNAHLAANEEFAVRRVKDYWTALLSQELHNNKLPPNLFPHDYFFLFGDLNFRLSDRSPLENTIHAIYESHFEELFKTDELSMILTKGLAFCGLTENAPKFAPTFKFTKGTSFYSQKRRPAWTDRVLFKKVPDLNQVVYDRVDNYYISDHKPVVAEFVINRSDKNGGGQSDEPPTAESAEAPAVPYKRTLSDGLKDHSFAYVKNGLTYTCKDGP